MLATVTTAVKQKVNLVEGEFTPSEAADVINDLINVKINFHKLQRLSECIHDECAETGYTDGRVSELMNEKKIAKQFIREARAQGKNVRINGSLEITIED